MIYPDDKEYWDGDKLFPYMGDCNTIISFSIRNIGKTYAVFKHLRKQIDKGNTVAISRYDRIELSVTITDFLRYYESHDEDGNLITQYKQVKTQIKETPVKIFEFPNGARVYFFAVKDSPNLKGLEIPNITRWYIDEIVPLRYKYQTRKYREFEDFIQLYHTIVRTSFDKLRVIMTANCNNWSNPYCIGWDIPKFKEGHILKIVKSENIDGTFFKMSIAIENVKASRAMCVRFIKTEIQAGRKIEDVKEELNGYARDPDCFISIVDNAVDTGYQIKFKGEIYGLYCKNHKTYVKKEAKNDNKNQYLLTPAEYDKDFIFDNNFVNTIEKLLNYNRLRFDSRKTESNIRLGVWLSHTKII